MSQQDLQAFMAKIENDKSLQVQLAGAKDANAVAVIAKAAGFDVTGTDLVRHNAKSICGPYADSVERRLRWTLLLVTLWVLWLTGRYVLRSEVYPAASGGWSSDGEWVE